jgi:hypothetical protein
LSFRKKATMRWKSGVSALAGLARHGRIGKNKESHKMIGFTIMLKAVRMARWILRFCS